MSITENVPLASTRFEFEIKMTAKLSNLNRLFAFECAITYNRRCLLAAITFSIGEVKPMMGIGLPELLIILLAMVPTALWIWIIIDSALNEPSGSEKIVWLLIVLLGGWIGAAIYWIVRGPKRIEQFGK